MSIVGLFVSLGKRPLTSGSLKPHSVKTKQLASQCVTPNAIAAGAVFGSALAPTVAGRGLRFDKSWQLNVESPRAAGFFASQILMETDNLEGVALMVTEENLPLIAVQRDGAALLARCPTSECKGEMPVIQVARHEGVTHSELLLSADRLPTLLFAAPSLQIGRCNNASCLAVKTFEAKPAVPIVQGSLTGSLLPQTGYIAGAFVHAGATDVSMYFCNGLTCATIATAPLGNVVTSGLPMSTVSPTGQLTAVWPSQSNTLTSAVCSGANCRPIKSSVTVPGTIDVSGRPVLIPLVNGNLMAAVVLTNGTIAIAQLGANGQWIGQASLLAVDVIPSGVEANSLAAALGEDSRPIFFYRNAEVSHLFAAHCSDALCSSASVVVASPLFAASGSVAVARGEDGLPYVAWVNGLVGASFMHCGNAACVPANYFPSNN
eukprot:PLAT4030.2.p1 GENE.PLAT4030.2~~PLAT4030.2.p1  ORF type:complete len:433 (-),score=87.43 PLAT4030.2:119-1417(-)